QGRQAPRRVPQARPGRRRPGHRRRGPALRAAPGEATAEEAAPRPPVTLPCPFHPASARIPPIADPSRAPGELHMPRTLDRRDFRLARTRSEQAVLPVAPVHLPGRAEDGFTQRSTGAAEAVAALVNGRVVVAHAGDPTLEKRPVSGGGSSTAKREATSGDTR